VRGFCRAFAAKQGPCHRFSAALYDGAIGRIDLNSSEQRWIFCRDCGWDGTHFRNRLFLTLFGEARKDTARA
jgi:hypothetical protein